MSNYQDKGVVLHSIKYGENQLIVYILTQTRGRRSYIARVGSRGRGRNLFQPLSLIEFQARIGKGDLHRLSQVEMADPLTDIPYNIVKSTIALFISEVLYRVLKEEYADQQIFNFVYDSVTALDLTEESVANFHLHFMVRLLHYMGFAPQGRCGDNSWFDIKSGLFVDAPPNHTMQFDPATANLLWQLYQASIEQATTIKLCREQRSGFLDSMVDYYGYHTDSIYMVNSIAMFREIF